MSDSSSRPSVDRNPSHTTARLDNAHLLFFQVAFRTRCVLPPVDEQVYCLRAVSRIQQLLHINVDNLVVVVAVVPVKCPVKQTRDIFQQSRCSHGSGRGGKLSMYSWDTVVIWQDVATCRKRRTVGPFVLQAAIPLGMLLYYFV